MMRNGRRGAVAVAATTLALLAAWTMAPLAAATPRPIPALAASPGPDVALELGADSSPAIRTYGPLTSPATIVPGDAQTWSVAVRNAGASAAHLTVSLVDVAIAGADDPAFRRDVQLGGHSVADLIGRTTEIDTRPLMSGETASIEIGYLYPAESTAGNHPDAAAQRVTFSVRFTLRGEVPSTPQVPDDARSTPIGSSGTDLPRTGATTAGLVAVSLGLAVIGYLIANASRRRPAPDS